MITKLLYLLSQGETLGGSEASEVFFGVTKLFQSTDVRARSLCTRSRTVHTVRCSFRLEGCVRGGGSQAPALVVEAQGCHCGLEVSSLSCVVCDTCM